VLLDLYRDPGLMIVGDAGCGKTSTLRVVGRQLLERQQPARAAVAVFDYRRTMLGEFDGPAVLGYAATPSQATELVASLIEVLTSRQPGPAVTPFQLRERNWWTGPQMHVLVDDYELLAGESNPLLPLRPFLAQAYDLGLHLYIARHTSATIPASLDPLLSAMRQLGFPAVLMSSAPDPSPLFGVHPQPLPTGRATLQHRRYGTVAVQLARLDAPAR
jgi:S-DNA-T family DNA segregation ATPase FtsK/SpoIIIE